jgi:hypothetical protein
MSTPKLLAIGGLAAAAILVVSGLASMVVGYQGRADVRDTLAQENIIAPQDSRIPGEHVNTGSKARAQAEIIREHQLNRTEGLTYAEMGRFATPDGNPAGTNDPAEAAVDGNGNPVANGDRASWITATTLITSLETAYFAEQVGNFVIVMGLTLLLTGIGLAILVGAAILGVPALQLRPAREKPVPHGELAVEKV